MSKFLLIALLATMSAAALAQTVTNEAICRAAGIGAGNISNYKAAVFDEKPHETMMEITFALANLKGQPRHLREKVDLAVVKAASPNSWTSVQAALNEFGKLCPCGGQSPCSSGPLKMIEKVN
ncbi:MAG: hypothetical protein IPJ68_02130 [Candidatus Moraniibacteriota bacterium]|nr:MAG: hypothetical protein IPJ68_02130 [Candidatus Moranbacteria bacterium]